MLPTNELPPSSRFCFLKSESSVFECGFIRRLLIKDNDMQHILLTADRFTLVVQTPAVVPQEEICSTICCWRPIVPVLNTAGILAALPHPAHLQNHISTLIVMPLPITHVIPHAPLPASCSKGGATRGHGQDALVIPSSFGVKCTIICLAHFLPPNRSNYLQRSVHIVKNKLWSL